MRPCTATTTCSSLSARWGRCASSCVTARRPGRRRSRGTRWRRYHRFGRTAPRLPPSSRSRISIGMRSACVIASKAPALERLTLDVARHSMTRRNRYDLEAEDQARAEVVAAAKAVLVGELGIIEGARVLSSLASRLVGNWATDPEFQVFGALDTETDH